MSERAFNPFVANEELVAMSPQDRELRRQDLLAKLKSKIEATELKYQEELHSQAAAAHKKNGSRHEE